MKRLWVLAAALAATGGCQNTPRGSETIARGRPPEYAAVATAYNQRVVPLERLWSRATIHVWYPDREQEGKEEEAQVDANLQYIRPDKVNLSLMHVGKSDPVAVLGSNEKQYWYLDLQATPRVARVGEHGGATPERIAKLDIPVHPLDLIELMGITPLPMSWPSVGTGESPDLRWTPDGRLLVLSTPGRTGRRLLYLDPQTYRPARVELTGPGGAVVVSAELSHYLDVAGAPASAVPGEVQASVESGRRRLRLRLDLPAVNHRINAAAFDPGFLLKEYRIEQVIRLDDPAPAAALPPGS
jgi:hypothetical protein